MYFLPAVPREHLVASSDESIYEEVVGSLQRALSSHIGQAEKRRAAVPG
jgi:hypothetical protein